MFRRNKKLKEECWNLDYNFIIWLNGHLKIFRDDAGKTIDLEFHMLNYQGKDITLLEAINRMIVLTDYLKFEDNYYFEDNVNKINELLDLFKLSFTYLWW